MITYTPTRIDSGNDYGDATDYANLYTTGTEIYETTTALVDEMQEIIDEVWLLRIINAGKARAFLRNGLFLIINPPKQIEYFVVSYWRKIIRCNRHGIGLRIRVK